TREIALTDGRRQLVGGTGGLAEDVNGGLARLAVVMQVFFHKFEGRSHDVVMMNVRPDGPDGVEPERMNELQVLGRERRRVRAQVVARGAAAAVMDDEPDG